MNLLVTTIPKSITDTQNIKRKGPKYNTTENHQATREENRRKKRNKRKTTKVKRKKN